MECRMREDGRTGERRGRSCVSRTPVGEKELTRGQKVEAEYFAQGGKAEMGTQFINVTETSCKKLQVISDDTHHV